MSSPISGPLMPAGGAAAARPKDIKGAAGQFEALMMGQMLKGMHGDGSEGWLGTGDDQAGACMMELAEEYLAQVLASKGGLGLANLVVKGLEAGTGAQATAAPADHQASSPAVQPPGA